MLVLSRKKNDRIIIGSSIEIVVTQVQGNNVKVGVIAPPDVHIHREEVKDRIALEEKVHLPTTLICCSTSNQPATAD